MENSLLIGLSRQIVLDRELDVVANNVANLNTTGFKGDSTLFEEYLMPVAHENNFLGPDRRVSFVQDRATWTDMRQGPAQPTGNPLDVALDGNNGNAFLVIQTARGERYTRNGSLQINTAGELVTLEGDQVLGSNGPIVFQPGDGSIAISGDGTISAREGGNAQADSLRGKLRIVSFDQPQLLEKDSATTFTAPADVDQQTAPRTVRVVQGMIEGSNVNAVLEMTRMVEINRTYTAVANLLSAQAQLRKSAIQQLAAVPS
jgi:flagellar basal-body rod protein FlgF